jgi:FkbH-like protein
MECTVASFNSFSIPRVAQLTQRSNQFNLRTKRYSEDDISNIRSSENYFTLSFNLKDKFGEHGLISIIILEKKENKSLFIDTWIMSCRVLKRNVEKFVLNEIVRIAAEKKLLLVTGEYIPTEKNAIVKDLYSQLGFNFKNTLWQLNTGEYKTEETFIKKVSYDA